MSNFNYNRVMLGGRLTGDPEVRMIASGINVVTFYVAVNRPARQGQEQQADFLRCKAFEKTAQFLQQYFRKGQAIMLEGHIYTSDYTEQGIKRFVTEIICERAYFVDSKAEASGYQQTAPEPTNYVPTAYKNDTADVPPNVIEIAENDELPF